jgi:NAD(P)-dependent dehydrogenase (short-subunit alcohol dehydrogenase family)
LISQRPSVLRILTCRDERMHNHGMGALDGRVAVITGAGRGLGREHALLFAAEGAKVVVHDVGGRPDGSGSDKSPAQHVAAEIRESGGQAVANTADIATAEGADGLIRQAIDEFGTLHVLVNNAGILRDRTIVNMTDAEWDDVIRVHLRGHFMPTRAAARYWREQSKAGVTLQPSLINTTSTSGLFNNPGQANYGAAKTGIATLTMIAQRELGRYGVKANAIAPAARTRLTLATPGISDAILSVPEEGFDPMDPANVSPFVAYLATADCPIQGRVFFVAGGGVHLFQPFAIIDSISKDGTWTVAELQEKAARLADVPFDLGRIPL